MHLEPGDVVLSHAMSTEHFHELIDLHIPAHIHVYQWMTQWKRYVHGVDVDECVCGCVLGVGWVDVGDE